MADQPQHLDTAPPPQGRRDLADRVSARLQQHQLGAHQLVAGDAAQQGGVEDDEGARRLGPIKGVKRHAADAGQRGLRGDRERPSSELVWVKPEESNQKNQGKKINSQQSSQLDRGERCQRSGSGQDQDPRPGLNSPDLKIRP
jgi:hypothetical protein